MQIIKFAISVATGKYTVGNSGHTGRVGETDFLLRFTDKWMMAA